MAVDEPKRQHYVPRTYLKNFQVDDTGRINVLGKRKQKIFEANIQNVGVEKDFYTVEDFQDKYIWEKAYANGIEPLMGDLIPKVRSRCENCLIRDYTEVITMDEKVKLSLIMVIQLLRSKGIREYENSLLPEIILTVVKSAKEEFADLNENQKHFLDTLWNNEKMLKQSYMQIATDKNRITQYTTLFFMRNFLIFRIIGPEEFIVGDNPVIFMDDNKDVENIFGGGLTDSNTVLYYPLSPKLLLGAFHKNWCSTVPDVFDRRIAFLDGTYGSSLINSHNQRQYDRCSEYAFSKSKGALSKVQIQSRFTR